MQGLQAEAITVKHLFKMMKTETKYNYDFKSIKVKKAFMQLALDKDTTLQSLIEDALKTKYKKQIQWT